MPQNLDFDTPSRPAPRTASSVGILNAPKDGEDVKLREMVSPARSVDLNKEIPLDDTESDDSPIDMPEDASSKKGTQPPKTELKDDQPEDDSPVEDDSTDGKKKDDEVRFDEDEDDEIVENKKPVEEVEDDDSEIPDGPRDYKSFPDQNLVPLLKKLPNGAYKTFEPQLRELVKKAGETEKLTKQLAERPKAPQFQYENPESYLLDPTYRNLEQTVVTGQQELAHWQKQLVRIANGEPWENLAGFDEKTGQPILQTVPAPQDGRIDVQSQIAIQNHLNGMLYPAVNNAQAQIGTYKTRYQQAANEAGTKIKEVVSKIFPTVQDVTKLEGDDKEWYDMAVAAFPQVFDGHPLITEVIGRMAVVMRRNSRNALKLKAELKRYKSGIEDQRIAGPAKLPQGGGTKKSDGFGKGGKVFKYRDGRTIRADEEVPLDDDEV